MSPYTVWLARIYAVVLVVWAIVYPQLDKVNSQFLGSVFNVVGAVLIVAGLYAFARTSPWVTVALVTLGAVIGTLSIYWAGVTTIAMIALIVLIVRDARRSRSVALAPAA
jgi:membrane-bound ClpP family serine protease